MTFDIRAASHVGTRYEWQHWFEAFVICRRCNGGSILLLSLREYDYKQRVLDPSWLTKDDSDVCNAFRAERFVGVADITAKPAPEHLPEPIKSRFEEGARCLAIGAHNAAGAMFRLCLDLATKTMLPAADDPNQPNQRQRDRLADRVDWLVGNGRIAADLADLAREVRLDGNDGAHDGTLTENEAEDLYDFAFALLGRLFTDPARLAENAARRAQRRAAMQNARADRA